MADSSSGVSRSSSNSSNDSATTDASSSSLANSVDSCDDWEEVYHAGYFLEYTSDYRYHSFYYFETFSGGPQGGYVVACGGDEHPVFSVERTWGTKFVPEDLNGKKILLRRSDAEYNISIRIVDHDVECPPSDDDKGTSFYLFEDFMNCWHADDPVWKFFQNQK